MKSETDKQIAVLIHLLVQTTERTPTPLDIIEQLKDSFRRVLSTTKTLDISDIQLNPKALAVLCEVLLHNKCISSLNLSSNGINMNTAVNTLAPTLRTMTSLTNLDLSNNSIDRAGAKAIAEALENSKTLTRLNLANTGMGSVLETEMNLIKGMAWHIAKSIIAITGFIGICLVGLPAYIVASIEETKVISSLLIPAMIVTIPSAVMLPIGILLHFLMSDLSWEDRLRAFTKLDQSLVKIPSLTTLDLSGNRLKTTDVKAIAKGLTENTTLVHLNLSDTGMKSTTCLTLLKAIETKNKTLATLDLGSNTCFNEASISVSISLLQNSKSFLSLKGIYSNSQEGITTLKELSEMKLQAATETTQKVFDTFYRSGELPYQELKKLQPVTAFFIETTKTNTVTLQAGKLATQNLLEYGLKRHLNPNEINRYLEKKPFPIEMVAKIAEYINSERSIRVFLDAFIANHTTRIPLINWFVNGLNNYHISSKKEITWEKIPKSILGEVIDGFVFGSDKPKAIKQRVAFLNKYGFDMNKHQNLLSSGARSVLSSSTDKSWAQASVERQTARIAKSANRKASTLRPNQFSI